MAISCDAIQKNITGIYLIRNKTNNKIYIGQSVDIKRRWQEHLRSAQPDKYQIKSERDSKVPIHLAMQKHGVDSFEITVLEECTKEQLNDRERYWIKSLRSNNKEIGYNLGEGGQENFALKGENHSQAKLTQKDVDNIINLLQTTNMSLPEINKLYPFVNKSTLSLINHGKAWNNPNLSYPIRKMSTGQVGEKNPRAKLTDKEVMEIRKLQSEGISQAEVVRRLKGKIGKSSVSNIYLGITFKHLPIWNPVKKIWIEPCIDYSSGSNK